MLVGKEFGPYLVDKELGSGSMGTVVRAKSKKNGERVAIKLMSLALGSSDAAISRFKREIEILKQLDHPNIVKYKVSGRYHGSPFYIMEYVSGESLDHILYRRSKVPWEEVVTMGIDLCAALQHAHEQGIIHRDLKPSNLMVLKDGTVKLTDFGIAKDTDVTALTAANSTVGTAAYMSPEQCRGVRDITHKTDLYSMGIMFYELLTGRKPFTGETAMEVFLQHANKTDFKTPGQIALDIPIWLDTLVCQLMEKDPAKRPLDAKSVAESLLLIKEKVEIQRSAGVETATKRRMDRASTDKKLDEDDKTAARAILGKKKKNKVTPFYAKGWFTILALSVVALASIACVYVIFLRTPSAESLYADAEAKLKTDRKIARQEPIALFLQDYPQHEKAPQVQKWADDYDFEERDNQMHNRRRLKFAAEEEEEKLAQLALDDEDKGKLADAAQKWKELSKRKGSAKANLHAWGLVGERYAQELQKVEDRHVALEKQLKLDVAFSKTTKGSDEWEQMALDAVKEELAGDFTKASRHWDELKKNTEASTDLRPWYLLAVGQLRQLSKKQ
jgi:eukaryotic-like serine/threonine-protein kinase